MLYQLEYVHRTGCIYAQSLRSQVERGGLSGLEVERQVIYFIRFAAELCRYVV